MKGTVFYLKLSKEQVDAINSNGWSEVSWGSAYLDASMLGKIKQARKLNLYEAAAEVEAPNADEVWITMQNIDSSWSSAKDSCVKKVLTKFTRSMSVGDYIVWEDGSIEICSPIGWNS